jgi:hypothetical protein
MEIDVVGNVGRGRAAKGENTNGDRNGNPLLRLLHYQFSFQ